MQEMPVLFEMSKSTGTTGVKMDGSALKEKSSFKMMRLSFYSKLAFYL